MLIYGLIDPRTNQLRYVGKSKNGIKRARALHTGCPHCYNWQRQMQRSGVMAEVEILQDGIEDRAELRDAEEHWIAYFKFVGCDLTNIRNGGQGGWIGQWKKGNVPWNKGKAGTYKTRSHLDKGLTRAWNRGADRVCPTCGGTFHRKPSDPQVTCSRSCRRGKFYRASIQPA